MALVWQTGDMFTVRWMDGRQTDRLRAYRHTDTQTILNIYICTYRNRHASIYIHTRFGCLHVDKKCKYIYILCIYTTCIYTVCMYMHTYSIYTCGDKKNDVKSDLSDIQEKTVN